MSLTEKICKSLLVSGLLAFLIIVSALTIYLGNLPEYTFTLIQLILLLAAFSGLLFAGVLGLLLCFSGTSFFQKLLLGVVGMVLCLWLQGNFFLWPLGGDHTTIHSFSMHPFWGALEILLYVGVFWLVFKKQKFFLANIHLLALIICATQLVALWGPLQKYDSSMLNRLLNRDVSQNIYKTQDFFKTCKQGNVIILLVDELDSFYFQKVYESDEAGMNGVLQDFESFPRFLSLFPQTWFALPTLLSGDDYFDKNKKWKIGQTVWVQGELDDTYRKDLARIYQSSNSLLYHLRNAGFETEVYPVENNTTYLPDNFQHISNLNFENDLKEKSRLISLRVLVEKIFPYALYRLSPLALKPLVFKAAVSAQIGTYYIYSGGENLADYDDLGAPENEPEMTGEPQKQWDLAPWDLNFFDVPDQPQIRQEPTFKLIHFEGLHVVDFQNCMNQVNEEFGKKYFEIYIKKYLDYLKRSGSYDSSYIVILGDHGRHWLPDYCQFNPALLIKRPNARQEKMSVNESVVLMRDIAPTILGDLGIQTEKPFSIWNQTEEQKKERQELWQKFIIENLK